MVLDFHFLQMALTFDPQEASESAFYLGLKHQDRTFQCALLNPVLLYREKQNLLQKGRGKENDSVHMDIAKVTSGYYSGELWNIYQREQTPAVFNKLQSQITLTQHKAPEIFLEPILQKLIGDSVQLNPKLTDLAKKLFPTSLTIRTVE
jgi:hypothetical protein